VSGATIDGDGEGEADVDVMLDLDVTPQGDAVAVGYTDWKATGRDLTVVQMRARTGRARGGKGTIAPPGAAPHR
jgi:hypothetical protein